MSNSSLIQARNAKQDEFYTQYEDIEKELCHYTNHFNGKSMYCNCDNPYESNFFKYFENNFNALGLKKLTTTCFNGVPTEGKQSGMFETLSSRSALKAVMDSNGCTITELQGNGDFRSEECMKLLGEADIVVTNPPFSLFREYIQTLMQYGKKFLILGGLSATAYKEVFPGIVNNCLWGGITLELQSSCGLCSKRDQILGR